jgi:hypothetical protein
MYGAAKPSLMPLGTLAQVIETEDKLVKPIFGGWGGFESHGYVVLIATLAVFRFCGEQTKEAFMNKKQEKSEARACVQSVARKVWCRSLPIFGKPFGRSGLV